MTTSDPHLVAPLLLLLLCPASLADIFSIVPLSLNELLLVLAYSLPVILIDEVGACLAGLAGWPGGVAGLAWLTGWVRSVRHGVGAAALLCSTCCCCSCMLACWGPNLPFSLPCPRPPLGPWLQVLKFIGRNFVNKRTAAAAAQAAAAGKAKEE